MDADAADILCKMGFGKYIGSKKGDETVDDLSEVCLNHPLNKGIEGESRTCFSVFAKGKSYALIPEKGAAVISKSRFAAISPGPTFRITIRRCR